MASFFSDELSSSDSEDADYVPEEGEISSDEENPIPSSLIKSECAGYSKKTLKNTGEEPEKKEDAKDKKKSANDIFKSFLEECEAEMKKSEPETSLGNIVDKSCLKEVDETKKCESGISSPVVSSSPGAVSGVSSSSGIASLSDFSSPSIKSTTEVSPDETSAKLFDFAGETVLVAKDGSMIPAKASDSSSSVEKSASEIKTPNPVMKRKGLDSLLGNLLNKKPKLSTLEKSKLDWLTFKKEEDITDELEQYKKGRSCYTDRKRFLERSDVRSYELERDMRLARTKKNLK